jgi:hypothetical protein
MPFRIRGSLAPCAAGTCALVDEASAVAAALIRTRLERASMEGSRFRALATVVFFTVATQ